jgi:hydroxymethylbilane synthase
MRLEMITALADQRPELSLSAMSGDGIFVRELETALRDGRIDAAVHSMKDLPLDTPEGLCVAAVLQRDEPRDALVSRSGEGMERLPPGARVGTSSLRRQSQLRRCRPDVEAVDIRGNVDTRLRKLDEGRYDAIVVAACGLMRLGLGGRITELLSASQMLPEPAQGALAIEIRADDRRTLALVSRLEHAESRSCVEAERAFLRKLGGGCRVPISAMASLDNATLTLLGAVTSPDGRAELRGTMSGPSGNPIALGEQLAADLASKGAKRLLTQ